MRPDVDIHEMGKQATVDDVRQFLRGFIVANFPESKYSCLSIRNGEEVPDTRLVVTSSCVLEAAV